MDKTAVAAVVGTAGRAPSIHNTQPWRFEANPRRIDLYADPARMLRVLDPVGRQLHISCGAALLHAQLGMAAQGRACRTTLLPDPANPTLLATLEPVGLRPFTLAERLLLIGICRRHTHRDPFDKRPLATGLIDELRRGVSSYGSWLRPVAEPAERVGVAQLLAGADAVERVNPAYRIELARWIRSEPAEDGVPLAALPASPASRPYQLREFDLAHQPEPAPDSPEESAEGDTAHIAVLGTRGDDPRAWLAAGQALAWLLLRAAASAAFASPLNQVVDLPGPRANLAEYLDLPGRAQMVLRMGYARGWPVTRRRPVAQVLDFSSR
ncbi:MAG: Acg family FMN-binding oxidoreductase [Mycobacteriales bacterium]